MDNTKELILKDLKIKEQILIETIEREQIRLEMLRDTIRGIESLDERKEQQNDSRRN